MKQLTSTKVILFLRFPANWKSNNNNNNNNNKKETLTNTIWRKKLTKNQGSCRWRSALWLASAPPAYKCERKAEWSHRIRNHAIQPMKNKSDGNRENLCDKMIPRQNHNYLFLLFRLESEKNNLEKENRLFERGSHLALSAFHLVPRSECSYSTVTMRKLRMCDFQCGVRVAFEILI